MHPAAQFFLGLNLALEVNLNRKRNLEISLNSVDITCSKLTIETLEQGVKYVVIWCRSNVFIVNF